MRKKFECERCEQEFLEQTACEAHERECGRTVSFRCDKCGSATEYRSNQEDFSQSWISERCWSVNLGRPGYGSRLDGCDVDFNLCDDCLIEFIDTFTVEGREKIHNSGSNRYLSTEDWIRVENGEMPDEEMEQMGMYSPRQISAYNERFSICANVAIVVHGDGSCGSRCAFGAFGDSDGSAGLNISTECFECKAFRSREAGEPLVSVDYPHFEQWAAQTRIEAVALAKATKNRPPAEEARSGAKRKIR